LDEDRSLDIEGVIRKIIEVSQRDFAVKENSLGSDMMRKYEKGILLHVIDTDWREHLGDMENMRQSIGLRGFAQKDPKQEYKREGFALFSHMIDHYKTEAIKFLMRFTVSDENDLAELEKRRRVVERQVMYKEPGTEEAKPITVRLPHKVGRNEVCFCGSGKKYKFCHGSIDSEMSA
jgi:preprotein translocase subunit SecA